MTIHSVCIYCGSRSGSNPNFEEEANLLGELLAKRGKKLVYGGGSIGLMGAAARTMLAHGGTVLGIIPKTLLDQEVGFIEASELVVTTTMRERKALMDERSDAFLVLPGGFGTLEELSETLTLRQLGYHAKPIIIINLHGYYDPMFALFRHMVDQQFVSPEQLALYTIVTHVEEAIALLDSLDRIENTSD